MFSQFYPNSWTFHQVSCNQGGPVLAWAAGPGVRRPGTPFKTYHGVPQIELPTPELPQLPLAEAIARRLSCRRFDGRALGLGELSCLLHGTHGILGQVEILGQLLPERPVPSGGARYPLELYLLVREVDGLAAGVYHYGPCQHRLAQLRGPLPWPSVMRLFLDQPYLSGASTIVLITAVVARTLQRYGDRGMRFVYMEAGHSAQNLSLLAAALELGSLDLGGFYDVSTAALLGVDPEREVPLYAVALGRPATGDRQAIRTPSGG